MLKLSSAVNIVPARLLRWSLFYSFVFWQSICKAWCQLEDLDPRAALLFTCTGDAPIGRLCFFLEIRHHHISFELHVREYIQKYTCQLSIRMDPSVLRKLSFWSNTSCPYLCKWVVHWFLYGTVRSEYISLTHWEHLQHTYTSTYRNRNQLMTHPTDKPSGYSQPAFGLIPWIKQKSLNSSSHCLYGWSDQCRKKLLWRQ